MKLSEIEAVAEVVKEETLLNYGEFLSDDGRRLPNLPVGTMFYTEEQMQEYAKAKVTEVLKACLQIKIPGRCNGKSAMIAEQFKNTIDSIFEEDTKNEFRKK